MADLDHVNKAAFSAKIFRRGQKAELFDDADGVEEIQELQGKLGELHAVWALERTGRDLAAAIWRPELGLAEVVLHRGKVLAHMGFTRGNKTYLFIEEAVYLIDRANLLLFLDGQPGSGSSSGKRRPGGRQQQQQQQQRLLSLAEAHELMAGSGVSLERYLVFCKLLRAGYIVQRHPARWQLKPGEDLAQAWAGWGQQQQLQQQQQQQQLQQQQQQLQQQQQQLQQQQLQQQQQQQQPSPPQQQGTLAAVPQNAAAMLPPAAAAASLPAAPPAKRRKLDAAQQQQRSGTWWVASNAETAAAGTAAAGAATEQQQGGSSGSNEGSSNSLAAAAAAANPWLRGLPDGFLEALPRCEVLPDAEQQARDDFPRMAPLPSIPLPDLQPLGGPDGGRHLLHYDVYASNSKFSRKQPGKPVAVVSVAPCTRLPTPDDMAAADAAAAGTPVRFATIEKGDICFYGLAHVELRGILSEGAGQGQGGRGGGRGRGRGGRGGGRPLDSCGGRDGNGGRTGGRG